MTISTASKIEVHPPLARDPLGNLLPVPESTSSWSIYRETTGRPRAIRGPDRQTIRFPLATTAAELVELCGAGVYRIYALDEVGRQIEDDHVARWDLNTGTRDHHRNGNADVSLLTSLRPASGSGSTDLRFALEAITQMMRTNSEALRIVTDSHVDLAKALVATKGLRNAPMLPPPVTEEDDDLDEPVEGPSSPIVELLKPFAAKAADMMPGLVMGKLIGNASPTTAMPVSSGDLALADRPSWEPRDLVDLNYAKAKGDAKRAAKQAAESMASLQARIASDPALMSRLFAIKEELAADEIETLMNSIGNTTESEQDTFLTSVRELPADAAVELCRDLVRTIRNHNEP